MAQLPESVVDPVASAIFAHYQAKHGAEPARGYLGASSIGKSCSRALWYGFRWAKPAEFTGRLYRLFQSGHLQEPRVVADLRAIGCQVYEVNPADGKQFSFSEPATGHHFRGNCDGILTGLPGAEKTVHMLEVKTSSDKLFKVLQTQGVEKAKPEHFKQMQIYMKWSQDQFGANGCKRALYVCVNKNTDEIHTERLEYQSAVVQALLDKALAIVKAVEPPVGISRMRPTSSASSANTTRCATAPPCRRPPAAAAPAPRPSSTAMPGGRANALTLTFRSSTSAWAAAATSTSPCCWCAPRPPWTPPTRR